MSNPPFPLVVAGLVVGLVAGVFVIFEGTRKVIEILTGKGKRPVLNVATPDGNPVDAGHPLRISVGNVGAAAPKFVAVVHAGSSFYVCEGAIGSNAAPQDFHAHPVSSLATKSVDRPIKVAIAAMDSEGHWWNAFAGGRRIQGSINDWLAAQCTDYKLGCPRVQIAP